jgi:tetratricopeptide (TPR) repeat protein
MARAAAKRNQGTGKAARAVEPDQARARKKAERSLEDELFFNRLRNHAKWVFVLLAIVFAGSFVFLGVGTGNAGLGDVFSNVFGGSSGASIEALQTKVAENPKARQPVIDLAVALERDGRTDEAIAAYRTFLESSPKDSDMLGNLAILYQTQAAVAANAVNVALRDLSLASPGAQFRPGGGALGDALGSFVDPISQTASTVAEQRYQEALGRYQAANNDVLDVYRRLAAAAPNEPSALARYAQAAVEAQQFKVALAAYQQFIKRFPDDSLVRDARVRNTELKQQIAQQEASVDLPNLQGQSG